MDTIDEENDLPLIIEIPKDILVQGLQYKAGGEINPDSLAFDTAGFLWDDDNSAVCLDLTFADKGGTRSGTVYIDPILNKEHSLFLSVQIDVGDYITAWSFQNPSTLTNVVTNKKQLQELFPRIYEMCKDNEAAMAELAEVAEHLTDVEIELTTLRQNQSPS